MKNGSRLFLLAMVFAAVLMFQAGCSRTEETPPPQAQQPVPAPQQQASPASSAQTPAPQVATPSAGRPSPAPRTTTPAPAAGKAGAQTAAAQPRTVTVPAGTTLRIRTTNAISTKTHNNGDTFTASLEQPLTVDGVTVAPRGATVEGRVVESDPGGRVSGVARLAVQLTSLRLADGRTVPISTASQATQARTTKKKDALKVGAGAGIGAAIGAIAGGGRGAAIGAGAGGAAGTGAVLATRGDPAVIGSEALMTFRLREPITVTR